MTSLPTPSYAARRFEESLSQTISLAVGETAGLAAAALGIAVLSAGSQAMPGLAALGIGFALGLGTILLAGLNRATRSRVSRLRAARLRTSRTAGRASASDAPASMRRADTHGLRPASAWPATHSDATRSSQ